MFDVPTFETERLILRTVGINDAPSWASEFIDYEIIRHLSVHVPWPYPIDAVLEFIKIDILPKQGRDRWLWGIFLKKAPNNLIGAIDLWRHGKPENRGFWLGRQYWGRGIMTEAVTPILDYAFDDLRFEKLIFSNAVGNSRSRRIKEKTGARLLRIETAEFVDPKVTEQEIWELTRREWNFLSAKPPS
jgi:ribosomal-protein-alanine N-acetyltransferase